MKMWLFHHVPLSAYRWPLVGRPLVRVIIGWQQAEFRKWRDTTPPLTDEEYAAFMTSLNDAPSLEPSAQPEDSPS